VKPENGKKKRLVRVLKVWFNSTRGEAWEQKKNRRKGYERLDLNIRVSSTTWKVGMG